MIERCHEAQVPTALPASHPGGETCSQFAGRMAAFSVKNIGGCQLKALASGRHCTAVGSLACGSTLGGVDPID